jgi:hypothetical protein
MRLRWVDSRKPDADKSRDRVADLESLLDGHLIGVRREPHLEHGELER